MTARSLILVMIMAIALLACAPTAVEPPANIDPISRATAPPDAPPGTCWGKTINPAVIKTRTQKTLLRPVRISADGQIQAAPIYKTDTMHTIERPRQQNWFEIPCDAQMTPDFVASVQRALQARGHYDGPITSEMDRRTRLAVRRYQKTEGFDSEILTAATARKLGLIAVTGDLVARRSVEQ